MEIKDYLRPPFSNYDVVVYFGCGLFSIPFLNRYLIGPMGLGWPRYHVPTGNEITNNIVSFLALAFSIYIVGHIIAYMASQIVEKWTDTIFGKISSVIISIADHKPGLRNSRVRNRIRENLHSLPKRKMVLATIGRSIPHIAQLPLYAVIDTVGIFGFYNTRISEKVVAALQGKFGDLGLGTLHVSEKEPWFKPLEYFVINRTPEATARMYNYLVIAGLFRSVSFIFLMSSAAVATHYLSYLLRHTWAIVPVFGKKESIFFLYEYVALTVLYFFCLASYLKFQRRYSEEAIYAFVFRRADA